jgi:hypothetical protein
MSSDPRGLARQIGVSPSLISQIELRALRPRVRRQHGVPLRAPAPDLNPGDETARAVTAILPRGVKQH